jgi:hypothetical protein
MFAACALFAACGGGDDSASSGSPTPASSSSPNATLTPLQQQLASVVLTEADLPEGLAGAGPTFSTNDDIAHGNQDVLAGLVQVGRQLGVDITFIPTDRLDPNSPLRGGVESSASVYLDSTGASQTFRDTAEQARTNDWASNYPEITDLKATELQHTIGDESAWIRLSGLQRCTFIESATPGPSGAPTETCSETKLLVIDNLIFRVGRVRGFVQVSGLFPPDSASEVYVDQVAFWANLMVQRAKAAFPA